MHSKTSKAVFVATNDVPSIVLFVNITDPRDAIWTVGCVYLCIVVSNATLSYVSIAYQFRIWVKESETSWALIGTRLIRGQIGRNISWYILLNHSRKKEQKN